MSFGIKFTSQANLDYLEIINYCLEQSSSLAEEFDNNLIERLELIGSSPEMFSRYEATNYRRTHLLKFKQQIVYQVLEEDKVILIVAIMHHSRNPNRLVKRLT